MLYSVKICQSILRIGLFTVTIKILCSYQCCTGAGESVAGTSTISPVLIVLPSSSLRSTGQRMVSCLPFSFLALAVSCSATLAESSVVSWLVCRLVNITLKSCLDRHSSLVIYEVTQMGSSKVLNGIRLSCVCVCVCCTLAYCGSDGDLFSGEVVMV